MNTPNLGMLGCIAQECLVDKGHNVKVLRTLDIVLGFVQCRIANGRTGELALRRLGNTGSLLGHHGLPLFRGQLRKEEARFIDIVGALDLLKDKAPLGKLFDKDLRIDLFALVTKTAVPSDKDGRVRVLAIAPVAHLQKTKRTARKGFDGALLLHNSLKTRCMILDANVSTRGFHEVVFSLE